MNYAAEDIHNLKFERALWGYKISSVDLALDKVIDDYKKMDAEILELKDKIIAINDNLEQYKLVEVSLKNALVVAQQTAEEIEKSANNKASSIIQEADQIGRQIVNEANEKILTLSLRYENMKRDVSEFKVQIENQFLAQLDLLNKSIEESLSGNLTQEHRDDNMPEY